MKVLWFTNTPSLYASQNYGYNGGGWIESLESAISLNKDVQLGIAFFYGNGLKKINRGNVTYYPLRRKKKSNWHKFISLFNNTNNEDNEIDIFLDVISDFKPDIINVFGSEDSFGLVGNHIKIPMVVHIQGILNPYLNAFYPPATNSYDILRFDSFGNFFRNIYYYNVFKYNAEREIKILKETHIFMGRTYWDRIISHLYSPDSRYFYCGEILRSQFYCSKYWIKPLHTKFIISTTISRVPYKGFDLILKTAKILKNLSSIDFEWNVYGVSEYKFWERKLFINASEVNVHYKGIVDAETLIVSLLDSNVFVHPSYIDNSPNSVCEAQLLGLPVISTNVGGISSLIDHGNTGVLVPANSPDLLAEELKHVYYDDKFSTEIGKNARSTALIRHDKDSIVNCLLDIYKVILLSN